MEERKKQTKKHINFTLSVCDMSENLIGNLNPDKLKI